MAKTTIVDASGLSCPQPVILTRRALQAQGSERVEVLVDTATSRDNCRRLAEKEGWQVSIEERPEGGYKLVLTR
ncbi:MAG: sulfurtransferase TusA family protein [Chloroflexi bacterium]|nr:sulfurtransferase TusA family protein [Chloroflexota bacterium]